MRIGLISVNVSPSILEYPRPSRFYDDVGQNTGNILHTGAIVKQLRGDIGYIGFTFDPYEVAREFDHVVIAAAIWINESEDWGFLADELEALDLPCTAIGLGAQAGGDRSIPSPVPGTRRFLEVLAEKSPSISVQGHFTKGVLSAYGIENVRVTGCPSLYGIATGTLFCDRESRGLR